MQWIAFYSTPTFYIAPLIGGFKTAALAYTNWGLRL
jgi:hypothetical protein